MTSIKVLFENEDMVVYDKPIGMVVNKSQTVTEKTLAEYSAEYLNLNDHQADFTYGKPQEEMDDELTTDLHTEFYSRGGIVHRLDKDTSGIVLAAKNIQYFEYLQNLFKIRKINKIYHAICLGNLKQDRVSVNAPIGRNPNNRFKFAVVDGAKEARTIFTKIKNFQIDDIDFSYIEASPITGRTHQIRVHLTALNLPIAGDSLYLSEKQFAKVSPIFPRLMLHAHKLWFKDEISGKEYNFQSELPKEFKIV